MARDLEDSAEISTVKVELVDRTGVPVAASLTVAGIVTMAANGGMLGPVFLLAVGLLGLVASGTGRTLVRLNGVTRRSQAERVRNLVRSL